MRQNKSVSTKEQEIALSFIHDAIDNNDREVSWTFLVETLIDDRDISYVKEEVKFLVKRFARKHGVTINYN